jgi:tripartite-type tricarboxylate transporter receptor subunit TctC
MKVRFKSAAIACLLACLAPAAAWSAQPEGARYPVRPVRIVIGFTPGGTPDITARLIGVKLAESLGQPVVVDNRPGAGGTIGAKLVAEANPDGHTLLSVSASHVLQPSIYAKLPYDTLKDFAGITRTSTACYLLVTSPSSEARTAKELLALAKAKPGQLNFASAGSGSGTHFAAEMFRHAAGIDATHIPYKGIPESLTDTMAGRVQFFMSPLSGGIPLVKAGKLRALGVSCLKRVGAIPEVPTLAETVLPGFQADTWSGMLAPAKTPRAIVNRLHAEVTRILALPEIAQKMTALGVDPDPTTPAGFDKLIAEQVNAMAKLARAAGIKPQ